MSLPIFHRTELASRLADRIVSDKGASGIFLAALRRTGKSTFIREDLAPVLRQRDADVIYVDLWADRAQDPGTLIARAIAEHLRGYEGIITQMARKGGFESVTLGGVKLALDKIGIGQGETLSRALQALSLETRRLIVMVVDEAQHAQTTGAGNAAMYALKAARDELNSSAFSGFRLVATGSNRDKLAILVTGKDQAFLNAKLIDLPHLGQDYLMWVHDRFNHAVKPSLDTLNDVFAQCSYRPEILTDVLDDLELELDLASHNIDDHVHSRVKQKLGMYRQAFMQIFDNLPTLQAAVMQTMAEMGQDFAAFKRPSMARYAAICSQRTCESVNVESTSVQYALDALRDKQLVWKSARGVYAIEDSQHAAWLSGLPEDGVAVVAG
ncbi:MAG: ATP-binding protein [Comamonadaceae bacterium]|nr:ATP-binding protein [Comamonadaceae bacterium]